MGKREQRESRRLKPPKGLSEEHLWTLLKACRPFFVLLLFCLLLALGGRQAKAEDKTWAKIGSKIYNGVGELIPGAITRGIDVSSWQEYIDWEKVKNSGGVDFVFIRALHGTGLKDSLFDYNMREANAVGIPVGVYCYSLATSYTEVLREAQLVLEMIQGYRISYPVVYDLEDARMEGFSKTRIGQMAQIFCSEISKAGYYPMIYCNQRWYNEHIDFSQIPGVEVWLARFADDITGPDKSVYQYTIWQASAGQVTPSLKSTRGLIPGIPLQNEVDIDIGFVDYTKLIRPRTRWLSSYVASEKPPYKDDGWTEVGGESYYYQDGAPVTGFVTLGGKVYFFDEKGVLQREKLILTEGGKLYYVDENGQMVTGRFMSLAGATYYFKSNGTAAKGLAKIKGKYYFFSRDDARMLKKQKIIDKNEIYYAKKSGVLAVNTFVGLKENGRKNYYYMGGNGKALKGFQTIGKYKYYFYETGESMGVRAENTTITDESGVSYVFNKKGRLIATYQ